MGELEAASTLLTTVITLQYLAYLTLEYVNNPKS